MSWRNTGLWYRQKTSNHFTARRSCLFAWLAFPEESVLAGGKSEDTNIFMKCELMLERQNLKRFALPADSEFKVKELSVKDAPPRSNEAQKVHDSLAPRQHCSCNPMYVSMRVFGISAQLWKGPHSQIMAQGFVSRLCTVAPCEAKKHFTEHQVSAQMTSSLEFATVVIRSLVQGTQLTQKNVMIMYNRHPYHGNMELGAVFTSMELEWKGPHLAALTLGADAKAVSFAKQQVRQELFQALSLLHHELS